MADKLSVKQVKPLSGYVLVQPAEIEKKTQSGIYLPDTHEEKPQYGTVLGCGDAVMVDGAKVECPVKVGDTVIYKKWGGNDFKLEDVEYQFLKFEDVLAVVKTK